MPIKPMKCLHSEYVQFAIALRLERRFPKSRRFAKVTVCIMFWTTVIYVASRLALEERKLHLGIAEKE